MGDRRFAPQAQQQLEAGVEALSGIIQGLAELQVGVEEGLPRPAIPRRAPLSTSRLRLDSDVRARAGSRICGRVTPVDSRRREVRF